MSAENRGGCNVIGSVDQEALYAIGNLGSGETLGKELSGDDESCIRCPIGKVKGDVSRPAIVG